MNIAYFNLDNIQNEAFNYLVNKYTTYELFQKFSLIGCINEDNNQQIYNQIGYINLWLAMIEAIKR